MALEENRDSARCVGRNQDMEKHMCSGLYTAAKSGDVRDLPLDPLSMTIEQKEVLRRHLLSLTQEGNSCLHIAARFGHEEFVRRVLWHCDSLLYHQNKRGDNPLHVAARAGHLPVVELLTDSFRQLQLPQSSPSTDRAETEAIAREGEGEGIPSERSPTITQNQDNSTSLAYSVHPPPISQSQNSQNSAAIGDDITFVRSLREAEEGERPSYPIWSQNEQNSMSITDSVRTPRQNFQSTESSKNGATTGEGIPSERSPSEAEEGGIAIQNTSVTNSVQLPLISQSQSAENSVTAEDEIIPERSPPREAEAGERPSVPIWLTRNVIDGSTALHEALRSRHADVALHLLDLETVDSIQLAVLVVNLKDESPLYLAAEAGFDHVVTRILEILSAGGHITAVVDESNFEDDVLDEKHITVVGPKGQTPLHAAVFAECKESIKLLHRSIPGLIKKQDSYGKTALYYAIQFNSLKIMHLLLKLDASSAYISDNGGLSPLLVAASLRGEPQVRCILNACPASIESTDNSGRNALHLALIHNTFWVFGRLLRMPEMMTLINEPDKEGNTLLHLATMGHKPVLVQALLSTKRVDLTAKNNLGQTALDLCALDWELSARQTKIWRKLTRRKVPWGRVRPLMRLPRPPTIFSSRPRADATDLKQLVNTQAVVAALLATITFAAVLQMPGGYRGDGSPTLMDKAALKVFLLSDTISLCCSVMALYHLLNATRSDMAFLRVTVSFGEMLVLCALITAMIAFMSGLFVVTSVNSMWVAILVCILGSSVPFLSLWMRQRAMIFTPFVPGLLRRQITRPIIPEQVPRE